VTEISRPAWLDEPPPWKQVHGETIERGWTRRGEYLIFRFIHNSGAVVYASDMRWEGTQDRGRGDRPMLFWHYYRRYDDAKAALEKVTND
jgi:hypothetical protein